MGSWGHDTYQYRIYFPHRHDSSFLIVLLRFVPDLRTVFYFLLFLLLHDIVPRDRMLSQLDRNFLFLFERREGEKYVICVYHFTVESVASVIAVNHLIEHIAESLTDQWVDFITIQELFAILYNIVVVVVIVTVIIKFSFLFMWRIIALRLLSSSFLFRVINLCSKREKKFNVRNGRKSRLFTLDWYNSLAFTITSNNNNNNQIINS